METTRNVRSRRRQQRSMRTHNAAEEIPTSPVLPPSQRQKQKKPLNFTQAMSDFQIMFPHIDRTVIEAVLRANDGVVQSTIDQLLVLSETTEVKKDAPHLPDYNDCQRSDFVDEPPPAYTEFEGQHDSRNVNLSSPSSNLETAGTLETDGFIENEREARLRFWHSPMIGTLPPDFLRLQPEAEVITQPPAAQAPKADGFLTDRELEQFLEDQKLALFLQNEEFIRQLRHDPDFVTSLEEDHKEFMQSQLNLSETSVPPEKDIAQHFEARGASASHGGAKPRHASTTLDDAAFRNKLRHMGHSTRKKFSKVAKRFSRKKHQKLGAQQAPSYGASTANLLQDDSDDERQNEAGLEGIQEYEMQQSDEDEEIGADSENKAKLGRKLPPLPPQHKSGNQEPIVFYSEDNEFDYKLE